MQGGIVGIVRAISTDRPHLSSSLGHIVWSAANLEAAVGECIGSRMGGYNWVWPQIPSITAMKYQRHGYVQVTPIPYNAYKCNIHFY